MPTDQPHPATDHPGTDHPPTDHPGTDHPASSDPISSDRLQSYRQPMVTGTGIILGFLFNFAGNFVKADSGSSENVAWVVFGLLIVGVMCLLNVLARALRIDVEPDRAAQFYNGTRLLFMVGVGAAVLGALLDMASNFLSA